MKQPAPARVSLRDIARSMRVHHTTVSRALRDDPRITAELRQRVHAMAGKLGYQPDPLLSAFANYCRTRSPSGITAALAWINARRNPDELRSFKEFDLYWQGATTEAARAGYSLEEFRVNNELTPARLERILQARGIRGILLPPGRLDWPEFPWDRFSVVRFGYSVPEPRAHLVTSHQLADGMIAWRSMRERGYRRIGLVTVAWATTHFAAGYLRAQLFAENGIPLSPLLFQSNDPATRCRALRSWLRRTKPDAILTDVADLRRQVEQIGYRVPGDIGLATTTLLDGGNIDAGIDQNSEEIGRAAAQLLISLINHNERGVPAIGREVLIEGKWVDGTSLPRKH